MSPAPIALAAALVLAAEPSAARASPAPDFDAPFRAWASAETPGCAVAAAKDGRTVLERAYGAANLEHAVPNRTDTIFESGSTAKQVLAAAVLMLERDGALSLDDDVRKYVPELRSYGPTITLRHLLHHTSGLRDWRYVAGLAGDRLGSRVQTNLDALAIAVRQKGLNHPTGAEHLYTNTGYTLLALVVERRTGKPLQAFTRERLFEPLGMASTQWRDDFRRLVKGRALAYDRGTRGYRQDMPFENAYGAGGLLTTAGDMLRWTEALRTDRLGVRASMEAPAVLNSGRKAPYGAGLFLGRRRGTPEISHGGQTAGYRAWTGYYPEHAVSVALLCNAGDANPQWLGHSMADLLLPANLPAEGEEQEAEAGAEDGEADGLEHIPWSPSAQELSAIAGRYVSDEAGASFLVDMENGRLRLRVEGRDVPPFVLSPTEPDQFVFIGGSARVFRNGARRITGLSVDAGNLRGFLLTRTPGP